jgi:lambda repressor-like predicted transcriptional regulator
MNDIRSHHLASAGCRWIRGCNKAGGWQGYCPTHYAKMRRTGRLRSGFIAAQPVRELIDTHLARGRTLPTLAAASGVCKDSLRAIHTGTTSRVRIGNADKLAATPLPPTATGCARRVQALRRIGYSLPGISAAAGITLGGLQSALNRRWWSDRMAQQLSDSYERISGTPGPSARARLIAIREGCAPPLAWDGVDIDDPVAVPDLGETRRRTPAELIAEYEHLTRLGVSPERAARQLNVVPESITQARHRAARLEVGEAA